MSQDAAAHDTERATYDIAATETKWQRVWGELDQFREHMQRNSAPDHPDVQQLANDWRMLMQERAYGAAPVFTATPTLTGLTTTGQAALSLNPYGAGAGNTGELRFVELFCETNNGAQSAF